MINTKWVKNDEIVIVTNTLKLMATEGDADVVWYRDSGQNPHIMLHTDFLKQYKPYELVYEYRYVFTMDTYNHDLRTSISYFKDDAAFALCYPTYAKYQRLDFTKRERK